MKQQLLPFFPRQINVQDKLLLLLLFRFAGTSSIELYWETAKSFRIRLIRLNIFQFIVIFQPTTLPHFRNMKVSLLVIEWWIIISLLINLIFLYIYKTKFVNYISYILKLLKFIKYIKLLKYIKFLKFFILCRGVIPSINFFYHCIIIFYLYTVLLRLIECF